MSVLGLSFQLRLISLPHCTIYYSRYDEKKSSNCLLYTRCLLLFVDIIQALGMESGAIADSQLTASSELDSDHGIKRARLHTKETDAYSRGSWVSATNDMNQWYQVDLGKITPVVYLATQGRNSWSPVQMVTKFKLQFSDDGTSFLFYKRQGESSDEVTGNIFPGCSFTYLERLNISET